MKLFRKLFRGESAEETSENPLVAGELPWRFSECSSTAQRMAWLESPRGQAVLSHLPVLQAEWQSGQLSRKVAVKYWIPRLNEWLEDGSPPPIIEASCPPMAIVERVEAISPGTAARTESIVTAVGSVQSPPVQPLSTPRPIPYGLALPPTDEELEKLRDDTLDSPDAAHRINPPPPLHILYRDSFERHQGYRLSDEQKMKLLTDGVVVIPKLISAELITAARDSIAALMATPRGRARLEQIGKPISSERERAILRAKGLGGDPFFYSGGTNSPEVLGLFYGSPLHVMVDSLLHGDAPNSGSQEASNKFLSKLAATYPPGTPISPALNDLFTQAGGPIDKSSKANTSSSLPASAEPVPRPFRALAGGAQVGYRFSQAGFAPTKLGGKGWHVDGLDRGQYGSFSLLIGIPLSDQTSTGAGNFCVHPGSHYTLLPYLRQYATAATRVDSYEERMKLSSANEHILKPDLGEPIQIQLEPGDVVMALHKVGHRGGTNYGDHVRKMVFIRVSHIRHQQLRYASLDNPWVEFEGLEDILI